MSLTLVTAPTYEPVSVDEFKSHGRITHVDEDPYIYTLLRVAREEVERFTNRRLITQTWDWRLDAFPVEFCLPLNPLLSVTSITYTDTDGASQTLAASVYTVDIYSTPARIVEAWEQSWPSTREVPNAVTVRAVVGYGANPTLVPKSLRQAVMMIAGHFFENRESTAADAIHEIPKGAEHLMWNYRVHG